MHRKDTHVIFIVFSAIFEGPRFVEIHKFCYYGNVTQRLFCMRVWQYRYGNTICNKAEAVSLLRLITRIVKLTSSYSQIFFFFFFYITHKYSFSLRVQGPQIYQKKKKKLFMGKEDTYHFLTDSRQRSQAIRALDLQSGSTRLLRQRSLFSPLHPELHPPTPLRPWSQASRRQE